MILNKKELLIKAYQLKNQGYNKSETINILKSTDININNYKTNLYDDLNTYRETCPKGWLVNYANADNYDYIAYIIDYCKAKLPKLDKSINNFADLCNGILKEYYQGTVERLIMIFFRFNKRTKEIFIELSFWYPSSSGRVSRDLDFGDVGIYIEVYGYSSKESWKMGKTPLDKKYFESVTKDFCLNAIW